MNATNLARCSGALLALALCAACGAGATVEPSNAAARVGLSPLLHYPTNVPDLLRKPRTFEYIINFYGSYASIFDYPESSKQIGTINNVGGQGCTNVLHGYGKKTFWIVAGQNQITEYRVPHEPIKTLSSPPGSAPSSCAMNGSGDLAVGILSGTGRGDLVVYKNASGSGTVYTTPLTGGEYFDGYDDHGNLFADGFTGRFYGFRLIELPKGSTKFKVITPSNIISFPGSVQWDGNYLTILDQNASKIYQYTVGGTKATLKGTVSLEGSADCAQTWIVKGIVYCADNANGDGEVFKYPAGGSAVAVFTGNFDFPLGVVAVAK